MNLKEDIKREEGYRDWPYRCSEGFLTVGYGHNLDAAPLIPEAMTLIRQAHALQFEHDFHESYKAASNLGDWFHRMPEHWREACIAMIYQLGLPTFLQFRKMIAALKVGDGAEAEKQALDSLWAKQTPERAERVAAAFRR